MARYLRQLAEQAITPTTALRSATAAAFPPEPAFPLDPADATTASVPSMERPGDADAVALAPPSLRTIAAAPDSEPRSPAERRSHDPITATSSASNGRPPAAGEPAPAPATARASNRPAAARNASQNTTERLRPAETTDRPAPAEAAAAPSSRTSSPAVGATLVPGSPTVRREPSSAAPHRPRLESATAAAPDIHIHIGRIELTAATPPVAAKRTAGTGTRPMTLDAYLRQRGRKTP